MTIPKDELLKAREEVAKHIRICGLKSTAFTEALTVALSCMELCEELEPADEEISDLKAKNEGLIDCLSTRDYAIADLKKILETPDKWMKWCDIRVLERCEGLEKEIAKLHTYGDCYKADYHDMKDERDSLRKEIAELKKEIKAVRYNYKHDETWGKIKFNDARDYQEPQG